MAELERLDVVLDDAPRPQQVLTAPPFRVHLDTGTLADGEHRLRIVAVYKDGRRSERALSFVVESPSGVQIQGLSDGEVVRSPRDLDVVLAPEPPRGPAGGRSRLVRVVGTVLLLGGVWALFSLLSPLGNILAPPGGSSSASAAAMQRGGEIYAQQCASCHGKDGEGIPGAFPPLAANTNLMDAGAVVATIHRGLSGPVAVRGQQYSGQMPAFAQLDVNDAAAVATYVRSSFGNSFGGVSTQEVGRVFSAPAGPAVDQALVTEGKALYDKNCVSCHQESGGGVPGAALPPLAHNPHLSNVALIAHAIRGGQAGPILVNRNEYNGQMPAFRALSANQIAALATYLRNSFGNRFGGVDPAQVRRELTAADGGADAPK